MKDNLRAIIIGGLFSLSVGFLVFLLTREKNIFQPNTCSIGQHLLLLTYQQKGVQNV